MSKPQTVLVIDDDVQIFEWMKRLLKPLGVKLIASYTGEEGLEKARNEPVDVILLDVNMPGISGYDVCREIRSDDSVRDTPIIFLTAADDPDAKIRAFESGATDYVTKPFDLRELKARIKNTLRSQALVNELVVQATTDSLTGLPNRKAFHDEVTRRLNHLATFPNAQFGLLYIDLDEFKNLNDSLGHDIGDQLLGYISKLLSEILKSPEVTAICQNPFPCRMGGDEFTVLLPDLAGVEQAQKIADIILKNLMSYVEINGHKIKANSSIGIRMCSESGLSLQEIFRDVDVAMYQAKAAGRGCYAIYDHTMHQNALNRLRMQSDLKEAIKNDQLTLNYQPLVNLKTGLINSFEALVRWNHPAMGPISPGVFIPLAEESELIVDLGTWVLKEASRFARKLQESREHAVHVCVNISKRQLACPDFQATISHIVEDAGISPERLELEITESTVMYDPAKITQILNAMRQQGFRFSIDDFGTGYSSLSTLPQFPAETLKIDQAFIRKMGISRGETIIVNAIISLAKDLGLFVVAEGVETASQLQFLMNIGCTIGQGYLLGRPMPGIHALALPEVFDLVGAVGTRVAA